MLLIKLSFLSLLHFGYTDEHNPTITEIFVPTGESGVITHPTNPGFYSPDENLAWHIEPTEVMVGRFVFFELEKNSHFLFNGEKCVYDYIKLVVNGTDLGRACGSYQNVTAVGNYLGSNNEIYFNDLELEFVSDENGHHPGFSFTYESTMRAIQPMNTTPETPKEATLNTIFVGPNFNQTFHYPANEGGKYLVNANHTFRYIVEDNYVAKAKFLDFDVEFSVLCNMDSLTVTHDGGKPSVYCGNPVDEPYKSVDLSEETVVYHTADFTFISDGSVNHRGFKLMVWSEPLEYKPVSESGKIHFYGDMNMCVQVKKLKKKQKLGVGSCDKKKVFDNWEAIEINDQYNIFTLKSMDNSDLCIGTKKSKVQLEECSGKENQLFEYFSGKLQQIDKCVELENGTLVLADCSHDLFGTL